MEMTQEQIEQVAEFKKQVKEGGFVAQMFSPWDLKMIFVGTDEEVWDILNKIADTSRLPASTTVFYKIDTGDEHFTSLIMKDFKGMSWTRFLNKYPHMAICDTNGKVIEAGFDYKPKEQ